MRDAFDRTLAVLAVTLCGAANASIFDGTWHADMNTARVLGSGPPWLIRVQDGQYACRSCDPPLLVKADGTDQPAPEASHADTVSIAVLDERTVIETLKRGGKTVGIQKFTVSDDGASAVSEVSEYAGATEVIHRQAWIRQSAGPPGSHSVSGSWARGKPLIHNDALTATFAVKSNTLSMRSPSGTSYSAPLSGDDAPYVGDPGIDSVSVHQISAREFEETDKKAGKAVQSWRWHFDASGQSGRVTWIDIATHTTTQLDVRRVD